MTSDCRRSGAACAGEQIPEVDHVDALRELVDHLHPVLDHQNAEANCCLSWATADEVAHLAGVEPRSGLVSIKSFGLVTMARASSPAAEARRAGGRLLFPNDSMPTVFSALSARSRLNRYARKSRAPSAWRRR